MNSVAPRSTGTTPKTTKYKSAPNSKQPDSDSDNMAMAYITLFRIVKTAISQAVNPDSVSSMC